MTWPRSRGKCFLWQITLSYRPPPTWLLSICQFFFIIFIIFTKLASDGTSERLKVSCSLCEQLIVLRSHTNQTVVILTLLKKTTKTTSCLRKKLNHGYSSIISDIMRHTWKHHNSNTPWTAPGLNTTSHHKSRTSTCGPPTAPSATRQPLRSCSPG